MDAECQVQIDTNAGANSESVSEMIKRDSKWELKN